MTDRKIKPPKATVKYDWEAITARLRRKPDTWIKVIEQGSRSLGNAVKEKRMLAVRDPGWEYQAVTRDTNGSRADLWMMAKKREG